MKQGRLGGHIINERDSSMSSTKQAGTERELCHWAGVDVSKATFDGGLVLADQRFPHTPLSAVPTEQFKRTREGVGAFLDWVDERLAEAGAEGGVRVCMEATGAYSTELAVWLLEARASLRPAIVNPAQTAAFIKSMGLRNKTDRVDARALGFYGAERSPVAYEPPTPEAERLRSASRYRSALVQDRVAERNRASEPTASKKAAQIQKRRLRQLERDIKTIEKEMKAIVDDAPELKRDVALLTSAHGVGFITAVTVITELGDLRRFDTARQVAAFAGLSPRTVSSGTSVRGRTRLCKQGNARVRTMLYMAAMQTVQKDNDLAHCYHRLVEAGKAKMVALCAVMRKLLCVMRRLLLNETAYRPLRANCG